MKLHEALETYLGMSKRAVAVFYRAAAFVGFSAGLSLVVVALLVPDTAVVGVRYLVSDAVLALADDLHVTPRFLVVLYGFLVSAVAGAFYLFTKGFVATVKHDEVSAEQVGLRFIVFVSFAVGFVGARAVVITAGLVGEETTSGTFLGLPIHQLDFGAVHIHHYFYGFVTLAVIGWIAVFRENYSKRLVAVLYGLGMGVFLDEVGMLLTEGRYFARSTYFAVVLFVAVFFVALYWDLHRLDTESA
ncbi:MAG: hypothetical protein U5J64_10685 [Halobacteriales archaeon]|nr:hypothetical protein [Halobacteriales archaeon]